MENENDLMKKFGEDMGGEADIDNIIKEAGYFPFCDNNFPNGTYCKDKDDIYVCDLLTGMDVLSRIREFPKYQSLFYAKFGINLKYLVILKADTEEKVLDTLKHKISGDVKFLKVGKN